MTENEYIRCSNLAKIRSAFTILADTVGMIDEEDRPELQSALRSLERVKDSLRQKVKIRRTRGTVA